MSDDICLWTQYGEPRYYVNGGTDLITKNLTFFMQKGNSYILLSARRQRNNCDKTIILKKKNVDSIMFVLPLDNVD